MELSNLPSIQDKEQRRLGRGYGSGRAKTSGRGTKGQKARGRVKPGFEGGQLRLIKRLPFRRGLGNTSHHDQPLAINAARLNQVPSDKTITIEVLKEAGLVPMEYKGKVKVIGLASDSGYTFEGIELTASAAARLKR